MSSAVDRSSNSFRAIIIITLVGLIIVIALNTYGPFPTQMRNMEQARVYAESVNPLISQYQQLQLIRIESYTGNNGSLLVSGYLKSEEDEKLLHNLIDTENIAFPVSWYVDVVSEDDWAQLLIAHESLLDGE